MNVNIEWSTAIILIVLGIFGTVAIIPYSSALQSGATMTMKQKLLGLLQGIVLVVVSVLVGMAASRSLGLQITTSPASLPLPALLGVAAGLVIVLLEVTIFLPRLPEALAGAGAGGIQLPVWKRFLASFYGGINEELMMRFFIMSGLLWLVTRVWHTTSGDPVVTAFWIVNIVVAVIFGLGHLPAVKMMTEITPLLVGRTIILNSVAGIIFGWVFWHYGLAAAMVSHFCADIMLHIVSPALSKAIGLAPA